MPQGLAVTLALAYGYLVGSIPTAYLMGRWVKGIDLRRYGSGNIGGANVAAHVGRAYFVPVVAFDLLVKGTTTGLLARAMGLGEGLQAIAGLAAVLGHGWPLYTRFVGGRAVVTAAGVLLVLAPVELFLCSVVAGVGVLLFRSAALWVGIAVALLPVWMLLLKESVEVLLLSFVLVVLLTVKRLEANRIKGPEDVAWHRLIVRRLMYDRDVSTREEWTERTPDARGDRAR